MANRATENKEEYIYNQLKERIFSGLYWPRQRLIENDLSREFEVGRSRIRAVLGRLRHDNLVSSEPYRGCFVTEVSIEEVFETYQVQAFLEGSAAYLATGSIVEGELNKLQNLLEDSKMIKSGQWKIWLKNNREFHRIINRACGNGKLIEMIKSNVKYMKFWFLALPEFRARIEEHMQILSALKDRKPGRVRRLVENHIMQAGRDAQERLKASLPSARL